MNTKNKILLLILSSIWGASFMFMKVLAPYFGPVFTASLRLLIGGLFLSIIFYFNGFKVDYKKNWKKLLLIGVISQSIPYFLFSYAALYIPSNISVIMNSTSPMFGLILSVLFLSDKFKLKHLFGLILGSTGVIIISSIGNVDSNTDFYLGAFLCVLAALFYGISGVYIKSRAHDIDSRSIASGSQLFASVALLPFVTIFPMTVYPSIDVIIILIIFGVLCSGVANIIYFKIMKEDGPVKALTVTYLMPVFGLIWGYIFLNEVITIRLALGGVIIILGTFFITSKN